MKPIDSSRLDVAVASLFNISRSQAQKAIKNGGVSVDSKVITSPSFAVSSEMDIVFTPIKEEQKVLEKPDEIIELDYVYKDEDIAIINKPRGLVVHPAPGHKNDTLVNQLLEDESFAFKDDESENNRPGIVHRIDKDTSGLIAVALNPEAEMILGQEVREGDFHREYLALVYGSVPDRFFRVDAPLTRPNHTVRKALVDIYKGRDAITHFVTLANNGKVSLLKCSLETGRTHQIRAHLNYIGFPIVGDSLYGRKNEKVALKGQALHAFSLSLLHPRTLQRMTFYAPIDDYFKEMLRYFYQEKK